MEIEAIGGRKDPTALDSAAVVEHRQALQCGRDKGSVWTGRNRRRLEPENPHSPSAFYHQFGLAILVKVPRSHYVVSGAQGPAANKLGAKGIGIEDPKPIVDAAQDAESPPAHHQDIRATVVVKVCDDRILRRRTEPPGRLALQQV